MNHDVTKSHVFLIVMLVKKEKPINKFFIVTRCSLFAVSSVHACTHTFVSLIYEYTWAMQKEVGKKRISRRRWKKKKKKGQEYNLRTPNKWDLIDQLYLSARIRISHLLNFFLNTPSSLSSSIVSNLTYSIYTMLMLPL